MRLDIKSKASNALHVLSKRPLSTTDIFLFNDARSGDVYDNYSYSILKMIKDGHAMTSKYNNNVLRFKIPNIIVVFSNTALCMEELSKDRWRV